jgi:hypothetical protein
MNWYEIYLAIGLFYLFLFSLAEFIYSFNKDYIQKENRFNFHLVLYSFFIIIFYPIITILLFFVLHKQVQEHRYNKKLEKEITNLPEFKKFHERINKLSEDDESL